MSLTEVLRQPVTYLFWAAIAGAIYAVARAAIGTPVLGTPATLMRDPSGNEALVHLVPEAQRDRFQRRREFAYHTCLIVSALVLGLAVASATCKLAPAVLRSPTWLLILLLAGMLGIVVCGESKARRKFILLP